MKAVIFIFGVFFTCTCVSGCKKLDNITGGGKGGENTIIVSCDHANYLLDTCIIYIAFGISNAPANSVYDDSALCVFVNGAYVATFDSLTAGNYYLLAVGYHQNYHVRGGKHWPISQVASTTNVVVPTGQFTALYPYILP